MGWTFTHKPKDEKIKDFFSKEFNHQNNQYICEVINCATILHEAYIAYQIKDKTTEEKQVMAIVCIIQYNNNSYQNFGYKDMDEGMGPYYYNCPERILKLLTPTTNKIAFEWRKKCQENIAKKKARPKYNKGDILEFDKPIVFRSGQQKKRLIVVNKRKLLFRGAEIGSGLYKLTRDTLKNYSYKVITK